MLERKVKNLFGLSRVESYSQDSARNTVQFTLEIYDVTLSELKELETIFGTDDIQFHVRCEEQATLAGDEWTECRVDVFVSLS